MQKHELVARLATMPDDTELVVGVLCDDVEIVFVPVTDITLDSDGRMVINY